MMNHERFMVPELLFHPSDVGVDQGGLHEMVWASIQAAPLGPCTPELVYWRHWKPLADMTPGQIAAVWSRPDSTAGDAAAERAFGRRPGSPAGDRIALVRPPPSRH